MACDCAKEEIAVIKQLNSALRTVNRSLRLQLATEKAHSDYVFNELCSNKAVDALGEIWERGGFLCSPDDYQAIVEACKKALEFHANPRPKVSA